MNEDDIKKEEEVPEIDPVQLIKEKFSQYMHSITVLTRAVKSCQVPQINQYLNKRLEQEPKWENKTNIVYSILSQKELPKCRFCGKQLSFSAIKQNKQYCSEECEQTDISLKETNIEPAGYEIIEKTQSFFDKIKNIFKRK